MTDKEIRILHNHGMEIGGHTVNHPILSVTPTSIAWKEIIDGKKILMAFQVKIIAMNILIC